MQIIVESFEDIDLDAIREAKALAGVAGPLPVREQSERDLDDWAVIGIGVVPRAAWQGPSPSDPCFASKMADVLLRVRRATEHGSYGFDPFDENLLWIDLETRSSYPLTGPQRVTPYVYVESPDWAILCASWAVGSGEVHDAVGHEEILEIPGLLDNKVVKVAHNAQFERVNLSRLAGLPVGEYLNPASFVDTQAIAANYGFRRSLAGFAEQQDGEQKDEAGTRLINLFCKPDRKGVFATADSHPDEWEAFVRYCNQDVVTMRDAARRLGLGFPTDMERRVFETDQKVSDRGVLIDTGLSVAAQKAFEENRSEAIGEMNRITGLENANSVAQLGPWLKHVKGLPVPPSAKGEYSLASGAVDKLLETATDPESVRVLRLRQESAAASVAKFAATSRNTNGDSRIRGTLRYGGAHTLRWAGSGPQLHNLPKDRFEKIIDDEAVFDEEAQTAAIDTLMSGGSVPTADLKKLVRAQLVGPFVVVDYSNIEGRVLAWLDGEQWVLDAVTEGRDIYVETAAQMGPNFTRQQGKVTVLACGYGGGGNAILKMGGEALLDDPDSMSHEEKVEALKPLAYQWRAANAKAPLFWSACERAFEFGGAINDNIDVEVRGNSRYIWLPSGRALGYHNVRRGWFQPRGEDGKPVGSPRRQMLFDNPSPKGNGSRTNHTFGGRLAENIVQAVARDVLAEAIVRLEDAGKRVVAHVHDEILVERVDGETVEEVASIMETLPTWAAGLPVASAGHVCERYHKD